MQVALCKFSLGVLGEFDVSGELLGMCYSEQGYCYPNAMKNVQRFLSGSFVISAFGILLNLYLCIDFNIIKDYIN